MKIYQTNFVKKENISSLFIIYSKRHGNFFTAKLFEISKITLEESMFRYEMNEDKMATDLLADGIRRFAADARAMEALIDKAL